MTNSTTTSSPVQAAGVKKNPVTLLDLAIVLAKRKRVVLGAPILAAALATAAVIRMPDVYTGSTKMMPPSQAQSASSALMAQFGGFAGMAGAAFGLKNPSDIYVGMLKSRTVADALIQRFDLNKYYDQKIQSATRKVLEGKSAIVAAKEGFITIDVDDKDPKRAAELANAYVEELKKLMRVLAVTEASQRRLFFDEQARDARESLNRAEAAARDAMGSSGLTNAEAQGRSMLEATAHLSAQITAKEVQIKAMRNFAGDNNQDLLHAQEELAAMKQELAKTEGTSSSSTSAGEKGRGFANMKLLRDVKYYETLYEILLKQYAMAKIDEAKESSVIQVLDKAIEPDRKSKPKRAVIVLLSTFIGFFLGILWAFIRESFSKPSGDPERAEKMNAFRRYLAWRN